MDNIASIEIGTNSIRMLIAQNTPCCSTVKPVLRKREITRLGENLNKKEIRTLKPGSIKRSLDALEGFFEIADRYGVSSPVVVATGVVRRAANNHHFINLIAETLNHKVEIISGRQEAELTCMGVLASLKNIEGSFVIFDHGGGSTEFIWGNSKQTEYVSIDIGAVTLTEDYLAADPTDDSRIHRLVNYIEGTFQTSLEPLEKIKKNTFSLVGTGGTVVNLAGMVYRTQIGDSRQSLHGLLINKKDVEFLIKTIKVMPDIKKAGLRGLEPGREDIILAGALVVMKIMDYFKKNEIIVSYSDILEGVLLHHSEGENDE
jgi:exopolyphosphatase / guanosine-5'-triphosphate,3'-diphosphate pyrophosphatase